MGLEEEITAVKRMCGLKNGQRLEVVSVGAGAWAAVFACLLKRKYAGLEDQLRVRMWRRPGKLVTPKQASQLLARIQGDAAVLARLSDNGRLLRYVHASLGRDLDPPLTAEEALEDGFCDTLCDAILMPMETCRDLEEAVEESAHVLVNGVPSTSTLQVWAPLAGPLMRRRKRGLPEPVVISLAKGVEFVMEPTPHLLTPTRLIHRTTSIPIDRLLYLGGPNIALELWKGEFATARLCGADEVRVPLAALFHQPRFAVWHNKDVITHEVMGGLKNVYAIGAGLVDEACRRGATPNSVYFANACAEMSFITHILSRRPEQLSGPLLADTYVTMLAGRNAWYGRQLASGAIKVEDGENVPGKGLIQGVSAVRAFASLLACAPVPFGPKESPVPAIDMLPTLRGLHALLFREGTVQDFVDGMWGESQQDPAERMLSKATREGIAFIPSLLAPEAVQPVEADSPPCTPHRTIGDDELPEPFLSDDKLAALGIDVEGMDKFRRSYLAFRTGKPFGSSGEVADLDMKSHRFGPTPRVGPTI